MDTRKAFTHVFTQTPSKLKRLTFYDVLMYEKRVYAGEHFTAYVKDKYEHYLPKNPVEPIDGLISELPNFLTTKELKAQAIKTLSDAKSEYQSTLTVSSLILEENQIDGNNWRLAIQNISTASVNLEKAKENLKIDQEKVLADRLKLTKQINTMYRGKFEATQVQNNASQEVNNGKIKINGLKDYQMLAKIAYENHVSYPLNQKSFKAFLWDFIPALFCLPFTILLTLYDILSKIAKVLLMVPAMPVIGLIIGVVLGVGVPLLLISLAILCIIILADRDSAIDVSQEKWKEAREKFNNEKCAIIKEKDQKALLSLRYPFIMYLSKILLVYLKLANVSRFISINPLYWVLFPVYLLVIAIVSPIVFPLWSRTAGIKCYAEFSEQLKANEKVTVLITDKINAITDKMISTHSNDLQLSIANQTSFTDLSTTINRYLGLKNARVVMNSNDKSNSAVSEDTCFVCLSSPFVSEDDELNENASSNTEIQHFPNAVDPNNQSNAEQANQTNAFGVIHSGQMVHKACFEAYCDSQQPSIALEEMEMARADELNDQSSQESQAPSQQTNRVRMVNNPFGQDKKMPAQLIETKQIRTISEAVGIFNVSASCPLTGKLFYDLREQRREIEKQKGHEHNKDKSKSNHEDLMWLNNKIQKNAFYFFPDIFEPEMQGVLEGICFSGEGLFDLINAKIMRKHKIKVGQLMRCLGEAVLVPQDGPLENMLCDAGAAYKALCKKRKDNLNTFNNLLHAYVGKTIESKSAKGAEPIIASGEGKRASTGKERGIDGDLRKTRLGLKMADKVSKWSEDKVLLGQLRSSFFADANAMDNRDSVKKRLKQALGLENTDKEKASDAANVQTP